MNAGPGAAPAAVTRAYRRIPPRARGLWNPGRGSNSHIALAAIESAATRREAWRTFFRFAIPRVSLKDGIPWWLIPE